MDALNTAANSLSDEREANLLEAFSKILEEKSLKIYYSEQDLNKRNLAYIRRLEITPSGVIYKGWSYEMLNYFTSSFSQYNNKLVRCNFIDDNGTTLFQPDYLSFKFFCDYLKNLNLLGESYHMFGWSSS